MKGGGGCSGLWPSVNTHKPLYDPQFHTSASSLIYSTSSSTSSPSSNSLHLLNIFLPHSPVYTGIYSLSIFLYHFLGRQLHLNLLQLNFVTHQYNGFWCFLPLPQSFVENFSYRPTSFFSQLQALLERLKKY